MTDFHEKNMQRGAAKPKPTEPVNPTELPANTIDAYILAQKAEYIPLLRAVRAVIAEELPEAEERMSWHMPTWWKKHNLIHFAAHKNHLGIYPGAEAVEHFLPVLEREGYRYSKGAVQFPYDHMDLELIRQIAVYCGKEEKE